MYYAGFGGGENIQFFKFYFLDKKIERRIKFLELLDEGVGNRIQKVNLFINFFNKMIFIWLLFVIMRIVRVRYVGDEVGQFEVFLRDLDNRSLRSIDLDFKNV